MKNPIPAEFDGYRIEREIGAGGMGRVYLGHDTLLDRPVAIKFISSGKPDEASRRRFLTEARAVARLQHPCVVSVYRVGEVHGLPYLVSEFVPGKSLDRVAVPMAAEQVMRIAYDLARGLAAAHRAGVIHRDIKPANTIMTADGTVKLLDFGVARLLGNSVTHGRIAPDPRAEQPTQASRPEPVVSQIAPSQDQSQTLDVVLPDRLDERTQTSAALDHNLGAANTLPGQVVGTPAYMSPEVWSGKEASTASDIYSLGALLYYLCTGSTPHKGATFIELRERVTGFDAESLTDAAQGVPASFASLVDRCLRRIPEARYRDGNELRAAMEPLVVPGQRRELPAGNPYRGLLPFEAEHEGLFFARDAEVRAVLDRVAASPVVVVCGDSGVGKSSLCRAGVLPRAPDRLSGGLTWSTVTVVPGRQPVAALASALAAHLGVRGEDLSAALLDGPRSFARRVMEGLGQGKGLLLFVDQLEEILTQAEAVEAEAVARLFSWTGTPAPGLRIVATVRADFLGRLAAAQGMGDGFPSVLYFLRPLSSDRVREAILGPAEATGTRFETTELIDRLVDSTAGTAGGLPLLQFALRELWERRDIAKGVIPARALEELGGVAGALSLHADEVLAGLDAKRRERAKHILMRLVTPEGTRIRRPATELVDSALDETVLNALVRGRLLVALESPDAPLYELAHEALLRGWKTLVHWLSADAEGRVVRERLAVACKEWKRLDESNAALWRGKQLAEGEALDEAVLSQTEKAFLAASHRRRTLVRATAWSSAVVLLLAFVAVWGIMHYKTASEHNARVEARLAEGNAYLEEALALGKKLEAAQQKAFELFDRKESEAGEAAWDESLPIRSSYQDALGSASREFEAAVALDPQREDSKSAFAQTLFLRAVEAERRSAASEVDEFIRRVSLYDSDKRYTGLWEAVGSVTVNTMPPTAGVKLRLEKYVDGEQGRLVAQELVGMSVATGEPFSLQPGSYRLALNIDGREPVLKTFIVSRGEKLDIVVALPPPGPLPSGFVFVPGGRFLFGSAEEDGLRRGFHHTAPIHQVETAPFFIARHETTFAQWLEYLADLPQEEAERRMPSVHAGGFEGAVGMKKREDGKWEFTFKPSSQKYVVAQGEKLVYQGRKVRQAQDWLRFPVVGITAADADAYATWLASTGRVPGARLCTDREWELAARGADGREYPHGHRLWPQDSNFDETYGKVPEAMGLDEVGSHPASRSPYGVDDMSGNAWEWVSSSLANGSHAARGGSFYFDVNCAKTLNRETPEASFRDASVGFRLCADVRWAMAP